MPPSSAPSTRSTPFPLVPLLLPWLLLLGLPACGGRDASRDVTAGDVDRGSPAVVTESELVGFSAPRDTVLTEEQVVAYLRTSLLQFELLREESGRIHENVRTLEQRGQRGALGQLQNLMDSGRTIYQTADLVGGSFVRSARSLGYNPAELEWVQHRMVDVAGYLMMLPMQEQALHTAREMRAQVAALRMQAGDDPAMEAHLRELLATAEQIESDSRAEAARSVSRNVDVLRRSRPAVSDEMWAAVGLAGGASGLLALSGWDDPQNEDIQRQLDSIRRLYQDVLDNRLSDSDGIFR